MEDWHDVLSIVGGSLAVACVGALIAAVPIYFGVRLVHSRPKVRYMHSWKTDLRPAGTATGIALLLIFVPSLLIGYAFSGGCGTGDATEVMSPDGAHKLVVYNFDCGATTDFSLEVSLLRGREKLPKHRVAPLLYQHYHQRPTPSGPAQNFQVMWADSKDVTVRVAGLDRAPITKEQDGIKVQIVPML